MSSETDGVERTSCVHNPFHSDSLIASGSSTGPVAKPLHLIEVSSKASVAIFRALASDTRAKILELLAERDMNINELSLTLNLAQPSISKHVNILEEAGLVVSDYLAAAQGMQKKCRRVHDRLTVELNGPSSNRDYVIEIPMPVGMYSHADVSPTCGLASRERIIGLLDDPLSFSFPERAHAGILWSGGGFVEYVFPNSLPAGAKITEVELTVEISSEAPGYDNDYPSDIILWINDIKVGTWTSPGDPGGERGRLNPPWWQDYMNQHGYLKTFRITHYGALVDDEPWTDCTISDIHIEPWQATRIRIGIQNDAQRKGGFTLFGKGFGSYDQDLVLRILHATSGGDIPNPDRKRVAQNV